MKNTWKLTAALAITAAGMPAQTGGVAGGSTFQQASQMSDGGTMMPMPTTAGVGWQVTLAPRGGGRGAQVVVGKPVAATEERKTVQTLADGTQLENSDSNLYYRDSQGRTRVEQTSQGTTRIVINDPVAHTNIVLNPATKTARKVTLPPVGPAGQLLPAGAPQATGGLQAPGGRQGPTATAGVAMRGGRNGGGSAAADYADGYAAGQAAAIKDLHLNTEDLGVQTVNGMAAQGTRVTQIIPAGRIGNNRDIHVVNERWFSSDLQMLVKTVNSDPRFGVTTYQLTNIVLNVDSSLFQIPPDYTVVEPGR